jgi:hypothetical protein
MSQDEYRSVIGGLIAPPAFPTLVRPRASDGTEHVPTKNPGAESGKAQLGNFIIDAGFAILLSVHLRPDACAKKPVHQLHATDTERILKILIGPCTVTVQGDPKAAYEKFRHDGSLINAAFQVNVDSHDVLPVLLTLLEFVAVIIQTSGA